MTFTRGIVLLIIILLVLLLIGMDIIPGGYNPEEQVCIKKGTQIFTESFEGVIVSTGRTTIEDTTIKIKRGKGLLEKRFYLLARHQFVSATDVVWGGPCQ